MTKIDKTDLANIKLIVKESKINSVAKIKIKKNDYEIEITSNDLVENNVSVQKIEKNTEVKEVENTKDFVNEDNIYGKDSLDKIKSDCEKKGLEKKIEIIFFQSNNEGEIIDKIHEINDKYDGLIINIFFILFKMLT